MTCPVCHAPMTAARDGVCVLRSQWDWTDDVATGGVVDAGVKAIARWLRAQ